MNSEIRFGRIGIIFIALLGVASIFILIGKKSIDSVAYVPTIATKQVDPRVTDPIQPQKIVTEPNTYKNELYGFGAIFLARAEAATECPLDARMAYDPIKEYAFAVKPIECAHDTKDSEYFYTAQGGQLETMVFDLKKCRDTETDQVEKNFCAKYDKVGVATGKTTKKTWPVGTWTKSGDYLTFYLDLTSGKNEHWKSDYKFLMLDR